MDEFQYRQTTVKDYEKLVGWWKWWRFEPPIQGVLPNNGANGIMVQHEGKDICCGFVYATSSPILFHIEWIISNPKIKDKELRETALNTLIDSLCANIKGMGGVVIYTSVFSHNKSLIEKYEACGFVKGSSTTEMIKTLS